MYPRLRSTRDIQGDWDPASRITAAFGNGARAASKASRVVANEPLKNDTHARDLALLRLGRFGDQVERVQRVQEERAKAPVPQRLDHLRQVKRVPAGRGLVHSEMPEQEEGVMEGFQLWLNLPAADKMCEPWYQDFKAAELPKLTTPEGVAVTVIAGESHGVKGAVTRVGTQPLYLDLH